MWKRLKVGAIGSMVAIMATTTACGRDIAGPNNTVPTQNPAALSGSGNTLQHGLSQVGNGVTKLSNENAIVPIKVIGNVNYVAANELIQTLKFQSNWEEGNQKLLIGDNDANFELTMNSKKATKEETEIQVSEPFVKEGDTAYIPVSALADLFQEDMSFEVQSGQLLIHPSSIPTMENENDADPGGITPELDFADDPADPFKEEDKGTNPASTRKQMEADLQVWSSSEQEEAIPVLKNIDINTMINKGKQYLGVKYVFGTGPYPQTGRFDCSTFTQYVYGKYGVRLPRVARRQAAKGTLISRKSLRKGDLLFFYVPGRFRTNRTIGHVGIYIGNKKMLHASPKPRDGVQITNIDKAYWKSTFLKAKRIVT